MRVEQVMGIPVGIEAGDGVGVDHAFAALRRADALLSTYRPASEIRQIDAGTLALRDAAPDVRALLDRCEELRAATGGYFDVRARGSLDPSGYAKGWAVERAAAALARAGARDFCIHAGGDVVVRGERAPGLPWRIGVQHPLRRDRVAAVLGARELAVATAGAYERGAHVVDPHTGRPPSGVLSVTVAGPDLGVADAYATAAFAMGLDGPEWTAGLAGYDALTILGDGRVLSTPGISRLRIDRWARPPRRASRARRWRRPAGRT